MWYANKRNFVGLAAVADSISEEPRWKAFADYCRFREQGQRKQAFDSLHGLIRNAANWTTKERRRFVNWVLETLLAFPEIHTLVPTPLNSELLVPTLEQWADEEPTDATPRRWLGIAKHNVDFFRQAIEIDPKDEASRYYFSILTLIDVDYRCHELPYGFLGDPVEALRDLDDVRQASNGIRDGRLLDDLSRIELALRNKVVDWVEFRQAGEVSFDEWCRDQGRNHDWRSAIKGEMRFPFVGRRAK